MARVGRLVLFSRSSKGPAPHEPNRLDVDGADFQLLTTTDLTGGWLLPVPADTLEYASQQMGVPAELLEPCVVVELPDYPWAWKYNRWSQDQYTEGALPIMVVDRDTFRGGDEAQRLSASLTSLHSLLAYGKPAPYFARIFAVRGR